MPRSVVYAISAGWRVKIGTTTDLGARLKAIQSTCPVEIQLLGTAEGDRGLEQRLHREFGEHRIHGEWFELVREDRARLLDRLEHHDPNVTYLPRARRHKRGKRH